MPLRVTGRRWTRGSPVGGAADQLVDLDAVGPGQRQQQLQGRPALAGLEPGQGADRDAGRGGQIGQRGVALLPQRAQPRPDGGEHAVQIVVHARQFAISARLLAVRRDAVRMVAVEVVTVAQELTRA